jgi:NAD(P)-dependent dehydrogenase (short-subunit alcohol dehydrogenase family)
MATPRRRHEQLGHIGAASPCRVVNDDAMGYGPQTTTDEVLEGVDLAGAVVVVTGASSGLGVETARALAAHGAEVVIAVRDPGRAADAVDAIGVYAQLVTLDLASLENVRAAADAILDRWPRVDVLVNNAGVMATPEERTADGFDLQLGTNHLGHFLLTARLAPAMRDGSRVVNVTSAGHFISGMHWDDPHYRTRPYNKWEAYGQSKTANVLFTRGLAQRGRTAYAVHPGKIDSGLYRFLPGEERDAILDGQPASRERTVKTVEQGAATSVWAATANGIPAGSYLADCHVADAADHATNPDEVERLWAWSEQEVGERFG